MADGGFNNLMSRLWSVVILAIVGSFSAHLVMTYVVPLVPYLLGLGVIALLLSLVVAWKRRW